MSEAINNKQFFGVNWRGGLYGGVVGGLVWLFVMMVSSVAVGLPAWAPLKYIGAFLRGTNAALDAAPFSWGTLVLGAVLHLFFSILYAFVLGAYIRYHSTKSAVFAGAIFGLILYIVNFHLFSPAFPWMETLLNPGTILAHLMYGLAVGWVYIRVEQANDPEQIGKNYHHIKM